MLARARVVRRALATVPEVRSLADEEPPPEPPPPAGVAHEPSPRRNVVLLAVPLPSLAVATVPLTMSVAEWVCVALA